jgi:hypothetical protein
MLVRLQNDGAKRQIWGDLEGSMAADFDEVPSDFQTAGPTCCSDVNTGVPGVRFRREPAQRGKREPEGRISAAHATGRKVVSRNRVTGTQQAEYTGHPPTGKTITYDETFILRFGDGRIAKTWGVVEVFPPRLGRPKPVLRDPRGWIAGVAAGTAPLVAAAPRRSWSGAAPLVARAPPHALPTRHQPAQPSPRWTAGACEKSKRLVHHRVTHAPTASCRILSRVRSRSLAQRR